jgi:hypothetical protein
MQKFKSTLLLAFAFLCVIVQFLWEGNTGLNLSDEGFLWYGVQRVMKGEVPILDFASYDPGRYYFSAVLISMFGGKGLSLIPLRIVLALTQAIGLFVAIHLISKFKLKDKPTDNLIFIFISTAILIVWMLPRHKLFDVSISIFLVSVITYLIESPSPKKYFISGVSIGLIAFFGRNHAMYGAFSCILVISLMRLYGETGLGLTRVLLYWIAGVAFGSTPILLMMLVIPGFSIAFLESILFLFEVKATNIPLPVPWPWNVTLRNTEMGEAIRRVLIGDYFVGILLFSALSIFWVIYKKTKGHSVDPRLIAASSLSIPYAHFAFSRAGVGHLSQGIFPFLLGSICVISTAKTQIKWTLMGVLLVSSVWAIHAQHPGWQCISYTCVNIQLGEARIWVDQNTSRDIALFKRLNEQYTTKDETFIAAPIWPGSYALFSLKSPMLETYPIWHRSESVEIKEIERIKTSKPRYALILNSGLDGRDDLKFKNTHPLTYEYIRNNFDLVPYAEYPDYSVFVSKSVH